LNFAFLKLRTNVKAAFEEPNIVLALIILIVSAILFPLLNSIYFGIKIEAIASSLLVNLILFFLISIVFFLVLKIFNKNLKIQQIISAFSLLWFYFLIATIISLIAFAFILGNPLIKLSAIALEKNFSSNEIILLGSLTFEKNKELFNALIEKKGFNETEKNQAMQLFDSFQPNDISIQIFFLLLLIASILGIIFILAIPYLIVREALHKSIPVNILLWLILSLISLFLTSIVIQIV